MLRVEATVLETVYVEEREGELVVHDRGETWGWIVSHPKSEREWDQSQVAKLSAAASVRLVTEEEEGELIRLRLERTVDSSERLADVVAAVADLVDAVFDAHSLTGGWRDHSR